MFIEILDRLKGERGPLLPKKKPEKELKKIRDANFEKAKPALENPDEVRRMFAKGDFVTPGLYGQGVRGSNIPLSEYEKEYKGITEYYNKTRSGKWSSLTPQQRSNFIKIFERNILEPKGLLKELKADPEKLKKFKQDVANNSRVEIRRMYGTKGIPLSESVLGRIVKEFNIKKFGKLAPRGLDKIKPEVTKDANKVLNILKNNPNISSDELFKKSNLSKGRLSAASQALQADKVYDGKKRFDIPKDLKTRINKLNVPRSVEETLIEKKVLKPKEIKRSFTDPRKAISKFFDKGTVFEHTFPRTLIPFVKGANNQKVLEITGTRTSPFLNQFKRRFDNLQKGAVTKFLEDGDLKAYNKTIDNIRDTVKKTTGGYEIGYIKFDKNKNATPVVNAKPVTEGFKQFGLETNQRMSAFKNAKYSSSLLKNYLRNPEAEIFNSLRMDFPPQNISTDIIKNLDVAAKSYEKAKPSLGNIKKFTNFAQNNLADPLVKALFKTSYGKAALVTGAALSPTLLAADEPGAETPDDFPTGKVAAGAAVAPLATKKGRSVYGKAAKGLLKGLQVLGQPSIAAAFAADELRQGNIKTAGASLLAPELVGSAAPKGTSLLSKAGRLAMNPFGRAARAFTPVGLATIGAGGLYDVYKEFERRQALTDEERLDEDLEAQEKYDEMMVGAADGGLITGRMGFAEGPKDPSRRKFIKIMGGLASLPLVGKYFKLAEPLSKAAPVATESVKLGFDKFMVLVNKIKTLGDDVTPQRSTIEREKITVYQGKDGSEYELIEDLTTGNTRVTKDKPGMATSGDKSYDTIDNRTVMEYTKGETIPGKKKGIKVADEYDEYEQVAGVDGTFDDVDDVRETIVKEIEDELK